MHLKNSLALRPFAPEDVGPLMALFRDSVRKVARRDYSDEQVRAWAPDEMDIAAFGARLGRQTVLVAIEGEAIAGFAALDGQGHIDLLFVHPDHQRKGAGRLLLQGMEDAARATGLPRLSAHVSLTARPLFEAMGFAALAARQVPLRGQILTNFRMEKPLQTPGQPS
ncbi:GNAT family N-acetyltransferase [Zavarzinia aquatilis]|uniref:GNAT family N-acetyltransferase n=1 Tax=Zavarzinia aquatilis TaxID=2211142 RepID=UPI001A9C395E|nr:GNAT family N-acetyltransferase [Zavarzinia aquatilis]